MFCVKLQIRFFFLPLDLSPVVTLSKAKNTLKRYI